MPNLGVSDSVTFSSGSSGQPEMPRSGKQDVCPLRAARSPEAVFQDGVTFSQCFGPGKSRGSVVYRHNRQDGRQTAREPAHTAGSKVQVGAAGPSQRAASNSPGM